jgi:uncharacterized alpha/beta hydrolase family protein
MVKNLGGQMKRVFFLLVIASFGIFALAGCGKTTEKTNTATTQNTAEKANTAATKNEEPAKNILKPGDVSPDKAVRVIELVDSVAADKDPWKGKEVAVTGYVSGTSGSGNHQLLTLTNEQTTTNKKSITCAFQGGKPDDVFAKTIEVKGKISSVNTDGEYKSVNLEPCELKK